MDLSSFPVLKLVYEGGDELAESYTDFIYGIREQLMITQRNGRLVIGLQPCIDDNRKPGNLLTLKIELTGRSCIQLLSCKSILPESITHSSGLLCHVDNYETLEITCGESRQKFLADTYEILEFTCGESRNTIPLNQKSLFDAVCELERFFSNDDFDEKTIARSLIILKQMIVQPITDEHVAELVSKHLRDADFFPPAFMLEIESTHENAVQCLIAGPTGRHVFQHKATKMQVVEVLSVSMTLKKPGHIYGAVQDQDGFLMYNRKEEDAEYIPRSCRQQLLLQRSEPIKPTDFVAFVLYLADTYSQSIIINDCFGYVPIDLHDRPLVKTCASQTGSVTLTYVVMNNSNVAQASVEVRLMAGEGEGEGGNPAEVCGELFAGFGGRTFGRHEIMLFRRRRDMFEYAEAKPGDQIMLSRSVVALPLDSEHLIIRANLHHRNSAGEIAKGYAKFPPKTFGTYEEKIFGKHGQIQILVTVNWLKYY